MNDPVKDGLNVLIVFALVALNAFFVAVEFALASLNSAKIDQLASTGSRAALRVQKARAQLDTCFAGTQLGVTMASLALGSIGEPAAARLLEPLFAKILPHPACRHLSERAGDCARLRACHGAAYCHGRTCAEKRGVSEGGRHGSAPRSPSQCLHLLFFRPFIVVLNGLGNGILRRFGMTPIAGHNAVHSVEELELLVHSTTEAGDLDPQQEQMVSGVFDFRDTIARKIMTPRLDITAVELHCATSELLRVVTHSGHSRLPVYDGSLDDIKGVIHVKDVLIDVADGSMDASIAELMRPPYFVPETKRASHLLAELRRRKSQMAVVLDEYGVVSGLVTIEDLLEEIVGDIQDEYDVEENPLTQLTETTWLADGGLTLDELEERLGLHVVSEEETQPDTLGGLIFERLGHQPAVGETVAFHGLEMRVEATDGRRVQKALITLTAPPTKETTGKAAQDLPEA